MQRMVASAGPTRIVMASTSSGMLANGRVNRAPTTVFVHSSTGYAGGGVGGAGCSSASGSGSSSHHATGPRASSFVVPSSTSAGAAAAAAAAAATTSNSGSRQSGQSDGFIAMRRPTIANNGTAEDGIAAARRAGLRPFRLQAGRNLPVFEVPMDIYIDLLYSQSSIRAHMKVHQRLASHCVENNLVEDKRKRLIERQILSIGREQVTCMDKLRACVNLYFDGLAEQKIAIDRNEFLMLIGTEIELYSLTAPHVQPIHVHQRYTEADLIRKLNLKNIRDKITDPAYLDDADLGAVDAEPIRLSSSSSSGRSAPPAERRCSGEPKPAVAKLANMPAVTLTAIPKEAATPMAAAIRANASNGCKMESMEMLINPLDVAAQGPNGNAAAASKAQLSLLKPRAERIVQHLSPPSGGAINAGASTSTAVTAGPSAAERMLASLLPGVSVTPVMRTVSAADPAPPPQQQQQQQQQITPVAAAVQPEPTITPSPAMNIRRMNLLNALKMAKHQTEIAVAEAAATAAANAAAAKEAAAAAAEALAAVAAAEKVAAAAAAATAEVSATTQRTARVPKARGRNAVSTPPPPPQRASPVAVSAQNSGDEENSNSAQSLASNSSQSPSSPASNETVEATYNPAAAARKPTAKPAAGSTVAERAAGDVPARGRPKGSKSKPKPRAVVARKRTKAQIAADEAAAAAANNDTTTAKAPLAQAPAADSKAEPKAKRSRTSKSPSPNAAAATASPPAAGNGEAAEATAATAAVQSEYPDLPVEVPEPEILTKLQYMKKLDMCTTEIAAYLVKVRSERPRRNVTSTERRDFHYGKLDLFEAQQRTVAKASSCRPVLYSPPRTRRSRKPVTAASALALAESQAAAAAAKAKAAATAAAKRAAKRAQAEADAKEAQAAQAAAAKAAETAAAAAAAAAAGGDGDNGAAAAAAAAPTTATARKTYSNRNTAKRAAQAAAKAAAAAAAASNANGDDDVHMHDADEDDNMMPSICVACKMSTSERVRECDDCNGFYHLGCHKTATPANAAASSTPTVHTDSERERNCPDCLRRRHTRLMQQQAAASSGNMAPPTSAQRRGK